MAVLSSMTRLRRIADLALRVLAVVRSTPPAAPRSRSLIVRDRDTGEAVFVFHSSTNGVPFALHPDEVMHPATEISVDDDPIVGPATLIQTKVSRRCIAAGGPAFYETLCVAEPLDEVVAALEELYDPDRYPMPIVHRPRPPRAPER